MRSRSAARTSAAAGVALLIAGTPLAAQAPAANRAVADTVARMMESRYVIPALGRQAADAVRAAARRGAYDGLRGAGPLANALETDLRRVVDDGHLTVFVDPGIAAAQRRVDPPDAAGPAPAEDESSASPWRAANHGIRRAEVLAGNVGYLEVREFAPPDSAHARTLGAALTMLANADALVIDLRRNGGGHGADLLASHFFAEPTHLLDTYDRPTDRRTAWWTRSQVPGPRLVRVPLYVLTSRSTYSAAEAFAYSLQAAGRAIVVGDTTGGGAHPTEYRAVSDSIILALPEARSEHPVTRQNWQGVGVRPDVPVAADLALSHAHLAALERLRAAADDADRRAALDWDLEWIRAHTAPPAVPAAVLRGYAGRYGERTLTYEPDAAGGAGTLYYRLDGRSRIRLHPVSTSAAGTRFVLNEDSRVEVTAVPDGRLRMHKTDRDGQRVTADREPLTGNER
jgi:hypothetical protein